MTFEQFHGSKFDFPALVPRYIISTLVQIRRSPNPSNIPAYNALNVTASEGKFWRIVTQI